MGAEDRTAGGKLERWDALRAVLAAQRNAPPLQPRLPDNAPPASFPQQRLWFLERLDPGTPAHTLTVAHRLRGPLNVAALQRAFSEIVRRHEALRTTLAKEGGGLIQVVHPASPVPLPVADLGGLEPAQREAELRRRAESEAAQPFDLGLGPLLRVSLLRSASEEHLLLVSVHHAIFDGWSFNVLMAELAVFYEKLAGGHPSPLPEPTLQYSDFAVWQRQRLQGEALDRLLAYWGERLAGPPPVLTLPADRPRRTDRDRRGASRLLAISPDLCGDLKSFSVREGVTLFTTLLTAFQILLYRYTGEEDVTVGSPVANRNRAELAGMIGMFVNTLALRLWLGDRPSIRALLARAREMVAGALAHQDLPFELVIDAVNPPRFVGNTPLVQAMFAFQNVPRSKWTLPGLAVESWNIDSARVTFDLTLYLEERAEGLTGILSYDASLFDSWRMDALLSHFTTLLGAMVADPNQSVATVPILSAAERKQLLAAWNNTGAACPEWSSIHALFATQAGRTPDSVALIGDGGDALTYRELEQSANQLARHLRALGVGRETRVGVVMPRSANLIVALLAILKAGGAYVPLDPATPPGRAVAMLRDADAAVLVADGVQLAELADFAGAVVRPDVDGAAIAARSPAPLNEDVAADGLAYVMFTSGSTGRPKAVAITHRGVVRLARGLGDATPSPADVLLALASIAFDASTFEIWGALLNGATLALAPAGAPTPNILAETIRRHGVTVLWLTAGLFEVVVNLQPEALAPLRRLLVGGDVVSPAHAARFLAAAPECRLINGYGPTENTTFTCLHPIGRADLAGGGPIPIGRPIANTRVYVLDANLQLVPAGIEGELCIAGDGLARGYLNDVELTRERFVSDPFDPSPGARMYRTGDRVRQRPDGVLEFLGRVDRQVKIRGFRAELGEVEAALLRCPGIAQAAVLVRGESAKDKRLVAYFVSLAGQDAVQQLRARLRSELPEPLVPAAFVSLDRLPLTGNGKTDRQALPPDEPPQPDLRPRDAVEERLLVLFKDVLGGRCVGICDNFFDAGVDSLRAVELAHRIEEEFGSVLPLNALFEAQTVAELAVLLREAMTTVPEPDARHPALIVIRRGSTVQPVFIVPGGHGGMVEMTLYARLMRPLKGGRAVYCLRGPTWEGNKPGAMHVEELATSHLQAVRSVQPRGPYVLMGECAGGAVAFEMAQQLIRQRETVAALVLLDSWCPSAAGERHYRWIERPWFILKDRLSLAGAAWKDLSGVARGHVRAFQSLPWRCRHEQVKDAVESLTRIAGNWAARLIVLETCEQGQTVAAQRAYVRTLMRYRPRPFPGRVTLIASEQSLRQGIADSWRPWADGGMVLQGVPGDHDSYIREHSQATLAYLATVLGERT